LPLPAVVDRILSSPGLSLSILRYRKHRGKKPANIVRKPLSGFSGDTRKYRVLPARIANRDACIAFSDGDLVHNLKATPKEPHKVVVYFVYLAAQLGKASHAMASRTFAIRAIVFANMSGVWL
jgi:hypothetical protein